MATYQELKDITELDISESLTTEEFLLYMNSAFRDLSEVYKFEGTSTYEITENDFEQALPATLFQVVSVTILNSAEGSEKEVVVETSVLDYDRFSNGRHYGFSGYRNRHIWSRFENKIKVRSEYYDNSSSAPTSTVEVRYYASIPRVDYKKSDFDLSTSPPIQEEHYHEALTFYIAYRYWLNNDDENKAKMLLKAWENKKLKIDNSVHGHRHTSNISRKIERKRR